MFEIIQKRQAELDRYRYLQMRLLRKMRRQEEAKQVSTPSTALTHLSVCVCVHV